MRFRKQVAVLLGFCALMPAAIAARPHTAYAATTRGSQTARACKRTPVALSEGQMSITSAGTPMDAICFVAGTCVTIWPVGTLMCGPTFIGCIIHYYQQ
jgi:hypothetical protein